MMTVVPTGPVLVCTITSPSFDNRRVRGVLVDAGSLVALLDHADPKREACVATLKTLRDPLITVWVCSGKIISLLWEDFVILPEPQ